MYIFDIFNNNNNIIRIMRIFRIKFEVSNIYIFLSSKREILSLDTLNNNIIRIFRISLYRKGDSDSDSHDNIIIIINIHFRHKLYTFLTFFTHFSDF